MTAVALSRPRLPMNNPRPRKMAGETCRFKMTNETRLLALLAELRAALGVGETVMQDELVEHAREIRLGYDRYQKMRQLQPNGFTRIWKEAFPNKKKFDELVDKIGLPN